ncbi:MAG TPA: NAD(P)H-hydrate epimerase [Naasia sp.]|jgi:hydroxyethylthiazole kinase-like uncharacterized protein yjeF
MGELLGYSAKQVRDAERPHLEAGEPLMAWAADGLATEIRYLLDARPSRSGPPRVLLLVGAGNNGGDALYAGEELAAAGADVAVAVLLDRVHEEGLGAALAAGARTIPAAEIVQEAATADVLVDGLVGTGSTGALRGVLREAVLAVLPVLAGPDRPAVVAVDIPSGIDPDTGDVPDPAVLPADVTVTFGALKAGLLLQPASRLVGHVVLVDIGLRPELAGMEPLLRLPILPPVLGASSIRM